MAGLRLVKYIREDLGNEFVRIVLRTGQPGQAPEQHVIVDYDINDYKSKTELTKQKLFTTVVSSLRAFEHIAKIEYSKREINRLNDELTQHNEILEQKVNERTHKFDRMIKDLEFSKTLISSEKNRAEKLLKVVIPIGVELSAETDFDAILDKILTEGRKLCRADAASFYLKINDDRIGFIAAHCESLGINICASSEDTGTFKPIDIFDQAGNPSRKSISAYVAGTGKAVNIKDVYKNDQFDFSKTKEYDKTNNYHSQSILTLPLKTQGGSVVGILQFINCLDSVTGKIIPFDQGIQRMMEAMSALATAAMVGYKRVRSLEKEIKELRVEIDVMKRDKEVDAITQTDFFQDILDKAENIKKEN